MRTKSNLSFQPLTMLGGPQAGTAAALAVGHDQDDTVFVGTPVGLYRSVGYKGQPTQGWERLAAAPIGILSVAVSPSYADDHRIVVGTHTGIFLSRDAGETWSPTTMPIAGSVVPVISFSPNYPADGVLLAGTMEDGIFYSADRGETWHSQSFGLLDATVMCVGFSPNFAKDETVYAGTDTTIYQSYNKARAWKELNFPESAGPVLCLAIRPDSEDNYTLYAGTEKDGLYRSVDRGESWHKLSLPAACVNALHITRQPQALLAATEAGIFQSTDQGESWDCLLDHPNVISLASTGGANMAGLVDQGLWMTTERGQWQPVPNFSARSMLGLVLSPHFDRDPVAYMFGPQERIWRTEDGGRTWSGLNKHLPMLDFRALVLSPDFASSRSVVAASTAGVLISRDGGLRWDRALTEPAGLVALSPNGKILAASLLNGGMRVTQDSGKTWSRVAGPWEAAGQVAALSVNNANHYSVAFLEGVGETLSLWQGTPGEFEKVLSRPAGRNPLVSFFVPSEPAPDRPWYAGFGNQVWKLSARRGKPAVAATVFSEEMPGETLVSLTGVHDPANPTLIAGTSKRVFKSSDAKSWTLVYDFGNERAVSLALSPSYPKDKTVYVLLIGGKFGRVVIP